MKIVCLLRVKNGERYIFRYLAQMSRIADHILVLDDGSTDDTKYYCTSGIFPKVDWYHYQELPFHGGRDRLLLHQQAVKYNPDWIIANDVDEFFERGTEEAVRNLVLRAKRVKAFAFPFYYMWQDEDHYRVDGNYKNMVAVRLFRFDKDILPEDVKCHSTACPRVYINKRYWFIPTVRIQHLGYMTEEERLQKFLFYTERDKKEIEGNPEFQKLIGNKDYSHIIAKEGVELKPWEKLRSESLHPWRWNNVKKEAS